MSAARDRVFDSLDTLTLYLANELSELNRATFRRRVGPRDSVLGEERLHLKPVPTFKSVPWLARSGTRAALRGRKLETEIATKLPKNRLF